MKNIKIICAEDDEILSFFLEKQLSKFYNDVNVFNDPQKALEHLINEKKRTNVLISDFKMPHLNGIELINKAYQLNPDLKKILLTGYVDVASAENEINKVDLILEKSILSNIRDLVDQIDQLTD